MVEFKLSEQQLMLKNMAKDFVEKELKPVAAELDRKQDPKECFSWDLLRKASKLGLRTMTLPEEWGGMNADILTRVVLGEELAVGDLGFTVCLDQIWKICSMICHLSTDEQKQRFLPAFRDDDEYVLSICVTEPGSGSDGILPYENPDYGIKT
ncbi:MAG: acyl-CoA dehydrogenase family protein, partial [Nitrospinota bacterium]